MDIIVFSPKAQQKYTIQVKSLSKRELLPLGSSLDSLFGDYLIICKKVFEDKPEIFIIAVNDLKNKDLIHEQIKNNIKSYWLEPKNYEQFKDNWEIIGDGYN